MPATEQPFHEPFWNFCVGKLFPIRSWKTRKLFCGTERIPSKESAKPGTGSGDFHPQLNNLPGKCRQFQNLKISLSSAARPEARPSFENSWANVPANFLFEENFERNIKFISLSLSFYSFLPNNWKWSNSKWKSRFIGFWHVFNLTSIFLRYWLQTSKHTV